MSEIVFFTITTVLLAFGQSDRQFSFTLPYIFLEMFLFVLRMRNQTILMLTPVWFGLNNII